MALHFFSIPTLDPARAQDEFNRFCAANRVVSIERQFVADGSQSHWALCVTVAAGPEALPAALTASGRAHGKVDYRQVLSEADFETYAELRSLRKQIAETAGMPVYAVFTNEHLAEMVRRRVSTIAEIEAMAGVGRSRIDRFGAAFAERLAALGEARS
jgi:superfamily II DNA helicase RecQ